MSLRRIVQLYFCSGCWLALDTGVLSTSFKSLFQVFAGIRISAGQSRNVIPENTLFGCFMECIRDPMCSAVNYKNYNDKFKVLSDSMVECEFLHTEGHRQLVVTVNPPERIAVKFSFLHESFQTRKFSNTSSSNITVKEIVSTNGQGEKYCFSHCDLRNSGCQELEIEKACLTNETVVCQGDKIDLSLPVAKFLQPNCSPDLSEIGK